MEFSLSRQVWGKMKSEHNTEINKNQTYCLGDLAKAFQSLVNSNSQVKILQGLYGKGSAKYSGLSTCDQMWTATQDVIDSMGNNIQEVELSNRETGTWK